MAQIYLYNRHPYILALHCITNPRYNRGLSLSHAFPSCHSPVLPSPAPSCPLHPPKLSVPSPTLCHRLPHGLPASSPTPATCHSLHTCHCTLTPCHLLQPRPPVPFLLSFRHLLPLSATILTFCHLLQLCSTQLWEKLTGQRVGPGKALASLESLFSSQQPAHAAQGGASSSGQHSAKPPKSGKPGIMPDGESCHSESRLPTVICYIVTSLTVPVQQYSCCLQWRFKKAAHLHLQPVVQAACARGSGRRWHWLHRHLQPMHVYMWPIIPFLWA